MRSRSLARVVMASLGVSVVITLGCGKSPGGPSPSAPFSVLSISPPEGPTVLATIARIEGTGFQSGDTVTVDGSRVDATVLSATTISLAMPAHAAGKVEVTVSRVSPSGAQSQRARRVSYVHPPAGHQRVGPEHRINRRRHTDDHQRYRSGVRRDRDGRWHREHFRRRWGSDDPIYLSMPAHAAGTVEVIVTDRYGQAGSGVFTYASPATFDFNGDWQGWARWTWRPGGCAGRLALTIRDNIAVSVSCSVCRPGRIVRSSAPRA